jgi:hypothetical protein
MIMYTFGGRFNKHFSIIHGPRVWSDRMYYNVPFYILEFKYDLQDLLLDIEAYDVTMYFFDE